MWTSKLPHLGGLPHQLGLPHPHVNGPVKAFSFYLPFVFYNARCAVYSRLSPGGHRAITDAPPLPRQEPGPGETHEDMAEINSRYHGLSLFRKCGHFHAPQRDISLVFL